MLEEGGAYQLIGTVRAIGPLLIAPLTQRACVAYVAQARVWDRLDWAGVLLREVRDYKLAPFVLDSSDGPVLVEADAFALELRASDVYDIPSAFLPRELWRYLRSTFGDEVILAPGERLVVRGVIAHARDVAASGHGYRDAPLRLQITGYADRPLRIGRAT